MTATVAALLLSFAAFAAVAHVGSMALVIARLRRPPAAPQALPPVTLLRPIRGIEDGAAETLASGFRLTYPGYELIVCVAEQDDPVIPLVRSLIAAHPNVPARLLIGDDRISVNPKLNNLVKGWSAARHEWIVMADSNVLLPPDYLERLMALWTPTTGCVASPPVGSHPAGWAAELECAFLNTHEARWQLFAGALGLGFAQGKTMMWRRDLLDARGGLAALGAEVAEDAAATKLVRGAGLRVVLSPTPFPQPLLRRRFATVWKRQVRWARLRRASFPLHFAPEVLSGALPPIAAAAGAAALAGAPAWPVALFAAAWYGAEAAFARAAGWHLSLVSPAAWLLRDLMLPGLYVAAWAGNGFEWRGTEMSAGRTPANPRPVGLRRRRLRTGA